MFALLIGKEPFSSSDKNPAVIYDKIREGQYSFEGKDITQNAKDILRDLLNPDPKYRLNITQIREHPWMKGPELIPNKI